MILCFKTDIPQKVQTERLHFASSFPGAIKALDIRDGHSMIVQKSAFLASEEGVELSMHFQKKLGKGMFGGEGFIMQKLSGNGTAFVEIDGHAVEYELDAGQEILISTGYLAAGKKPAQWML